MGRSKRLGSGTRSTGLAIEYVRTRKVVRLLGWMDDAPIVPVEIPLDQLCDSLGISPRDLGAPRQFLLFAGPHGRPAGGLRDLVGTFDVEESAWAAFRELRQAHPSSQGWAELATIDGRGHVTQMAWFGLHPASDAGNPTPPARQPLLRTRTRALHRPIRRTGSDGYLRAVTPS
ncbi:MAG: hypothetical protein ACR2KK_04710 [Acidimicrobiales bacterium]